MLTYLLDWAGLLVRWLHVIAGIAWIGASFYFVWLDNHLEPLGGVRADPNIAGELWAVHGGGFYRSQKYRLAPAQLPTRLHWFYWEAYATWLSGFGLLCLLYFVRAEAYLIDPAVLPLGKTAAIGSALGVLAANWLIYDVLCRSPLGRGRGLGVAVAALVAADAWGLCHLFGGRGAFMIFGSTLGTIMVANVLFVIIPGQRELVLAKRQGRVPDAGPGLRGKQRSVHNTYFTLPVVFVMISNHYAMTYGGRRNWLVLIAMSCAGACLRAWFVARHNPAATTGLRRALPGVLGLGVLGAVILGTSPPLIEAPVASAGSADAAAEQARAQHIVEVRCQPCHATSPRQPGFAAAPNGLVFERVEQLLTHLPEVRQQLTARSMPLGNLTQMTDDERAALLRWIGREGRT